MTVIRHPNNQGVTLSQWRKTAAGGETSVSGTDDFSAGLAYTAGAEQVFVNGVLLERGVDYTASTGTTVTGLTALVAGDIATVSSPSAFNVANAIPKATITAKGDLLVGTGASTPTNLGVGADGTTLVADSSTSTGLRYNPQNALVNPVIGGGQDIWQRGTSISIAASSAITYTSDRFCTTTGANQASTISRQATGDTTNLPNIQYALRYQRNSGQTGTANLSLATSIESTNSIPYAGKAVTLSFYARAGANYSAASSAFPVYLYGSTGTDQNILSVWAGSSTVGATTATLTTTWQRFVVTGTVGATVTQLAIQTYFSPTGTAGASDYYDITGIQIDLGTYTATTAPAFRRSGGTLQGELTACQRYLPAVMVGSGNRIYGYASATNQSYSSVTYPVTARVAPTGILPAAVANFTMVTSAGATGTPLTIAFDSAGVNSASISYTSTVGSPTIAANTIVQLAATASGAYILFTGCEL